MGGMPDAGNARSCLLYVYYAKLSGAGVAGSASESDFGRGQCRGSVSATTNESDTDW